MQPETSGATGRMADVAHASGFGTWISAPILFVALTVTAVVSGGLTLVGRLAGTILRGIWLGLAVFGHLRAIPAGLRAGLARTFTFHPETSGHGRPGDAAFHGAPSKPDAKAPAMPAELAMAVIEPALAATPDKGGPAMPDDLGILAVLLGPTPPANDFKAADMVRDCFAPLGAEAGKSRALLAVAMRLAREFGTPTRLPLATAGAWHMLDPAMFEDEMAAELSAISRFISEWHKSQQTFLCLEFAEIELIEFLFESLSPARHADIQCDVLNFKALSNRRQGLLRRIPHRLRKFVQDAGPTAATIAHVEAVRTLLDRIAASHGYAPIIEAATASLEEVKKIAEKLQPAAAPAAPGAGGQALARITPVKRPASELADQAGLAPPRHPDAPAQAARPPQPQRPPSAPPPTSPRAVGTVPATIPGRRSIAASPRFSATAPPRNTPDGITTVASRPPPALLSSTPRPLPPGSRPPLPTVVMGPLPVLAAVAPIPTSALPRPQTQPASFTGRIALPPSASPPVAGARPASPTSVTQPASTGVATGRVVIPPARPAPAAASSASVTDLTVVAKSKRPPITQAIKRQSVLKVLRGESTAAIAAALGIRESKLDEWVDAFITAGAGALSPAPRKARPRKTVDNVPLSAELLRAKLAEVLATAQMIERAMDAQIPPRRPVLLPPPDADGGRHHPTRRPHKKG